MFSVSHIRNLQSGNGRRKARDRSCYFEAELVHAIHYSITETAFVDHDIHFLNCHARYYLDQCSDKISPLYQGHRRRIRELFSLVPETRRVQLDWDGPDDQSLSHGTSKNTE